MKITLGRTGVDCRVYTDDGRDITEDLFITKIEVYADARGDTRAVLHVLPMVVEAEIDDALVESTPADA